MAEYLAMRIQEGAMDYKAVVDRFPRYKAEIDRILGKEVTA